jgi:hypothetical protein
MFPKGCDKFSKTKLFTCGGQISRQAPRIEKAEKGTDLFYLTTFTPTQQDSRIPGTPYLIINGIPGTPYLILKNDLSFCFFPQIFNEFFILHFTF